MTQTESKQSKQAEGSERIMIIDDDLIQARLLEKILVTDGYRVTIFSDGPSAIEAAETDPPDIILTDVIMPDVDGFEVIRSLKDRETTADIPVILVTADRNRQSEYEGLRSGAVDYITKPFAAPVVTARIRTHVELKRHRDELESLVRQQTAALDLSRRQFKDLVEKSLVGIAIVMNQKVVYQNPELLRIIKDLDKKVADRDFSFVHTDDWPRVQYAYKILTGQKTQQVEVDLRILKGNGEKTDLENTWLNCRAVKFNYQEQDAILVNITDISHTKELERLLLLRNKMASLGRIASGMAHEIRNPLTGITSYIYSLEQLCRKPTLLPKDFELMGDIVGQLKLATHKVDAVIKRVLNFSKSTPPQMVPVDLNKCLNNVLQLTAVTLRKAKIEVTTDLTSPLPYCFGEVALIEQVIINLVQNAAEALKKSEAKKQIAIRSYTSQNRVYASIADSGPGVPADIREKIFDPFFTTHPEGSGIGLSIAQRIITDHNGTLSLDDGPLGGARFLISIPIEKRKLSR